MGYKIQKKEDLPLVIVTFDENFGEKEEMVAYIAELREVYDHLPAPFIKSRIYPASHWISRVYYRFRTYAVYRRNKGFKPLV